MQLVFVANVSHFFLRGNALFRGGGLNSLSKAFSHFSPSPPPPCSTHLLFNLFYLLCLTTVTADAAQVCLHPQNCSATTAKTLFSSSGKHRFPGSEREGWCAAVFSLNNNANNTTLSISRNLSFPFHSFFPPLTALALLRGTLLSFTFCLFFLPVLFVLSRACNCVFEGPHTPPFCFRESALMCV